MRSRLLLEPLALKPDPLGKRVKLTSLAFDREMGRASMERRTSVGPDADLIHHDDHDDHFVRREASRRGSRTARTWWLVASPERGNGLASRVGCRRSMATWPRNPLPCSDRRRDRDNSTRSTSWPLGSRLPSCDVCNGRASRASVSSEFFDGRADESHSVYTQCDHRRQVGD